MVSSAAVIIVVPSATTFAQLIKSPTDGPYESSPVLYCFLNSAPALIIISALL